MKYILSLDQGTSSSRAILFDEKTRLAYLEQAEFQQYYPKQNWVEQSAKEIWESQLEVTKKVIGDRIHQIHAIGITNQRETTILWDKHTGEPVYNAIVWQDQRTSKRCDFLKHDFQDIIHRKTGLIIDSYFSATKIEWILNNVEHARKKAEKGDLLFGTVDSWLVWNLTKGALHITDVSNASRTMLFNINTLEWDSDLLDLFNIPKSILPKVVSSSEVYGTTHSSIFGKEIPISGIAGDQQAALFGQTCFEKGMIKNTYGTGCFMLMNTGSKVKYSNNGLLSTIAWQINGQTTYALEGSIFMAGATIKWLRDQLNIIKKASETEALALSVKDNGGVYIVPAFSGLGAPYWNSDVNGMVKGLTLSTTKAHIVRATLESIAYRTKDILALMAEESEIELLSLSADGGASKNKFLMQFQSDILNIDINLPQNVETTALGTAYLAGLATQFWTLNEIQNYHKISAIYRPNMSESNRRTLYKEWQKAVYDLITSANSY